MGADRSTSERVGPVGVAIVDDDRRYGTALADLIELSDHFVVVGVAEGVESGNTLLGNQAVQLGLVDVNMAGGGGQAIIRTCRTWSERPTLVLISAQAPPPDVEELGVPFIAKDELDTQLLWTLWRQSAR
ncbi:MAG: response regulator [Actinomycetota bacterium]